MSGWVLPEVLRDAPAYTPRPNELADLELLLSGAYAPLTDLPTREDLHRDHSRGRLADGTPWPVPITLEVPAHLHHAASTGTTRSVAPSSSPTWRARPSPRST